MLVVAIVEIPERPHRHWLGQLQRLQHQELRFSHDHDMLARDGAISHFTQALFSFANRDSHFIQLIIDKNWTISSPNTDDSELGASQQPRRLLPPQTRCLCY